MGRRLWGVAAVLVAGVRCNAAPPVPPNPILPTAPDFGTTKTLDVVAPPISGGTMVLSHDGKTAVAADSDRDMVSFVDIASATVRAQVNLTAHDEPGRVAEDSGGRIHVALRGSGELASFTLATGQLLERRSVCPQPRGVAYDATTDQVVVACATGELVMLPAAAGPAAQSYVIEPDLRDVVIDGNFLYVSKFRTAEILQINRSGVVVQRATLPVNSFGGGSTSTPAQAWRMRGTLNHRLYVSYQVDSTSFVPTTPGGYGSGAGFGGGGGAGTTGGPAAVAASGGVGGFNPATDNVAGFIGPTSFGGGIVQTGIASISTPDMTVTPENGLVDSVVLPVDLALPPVGATKAVLVAAGNWKSSVTAPYLAFEPGSGASSQFAPVDGQIVAAEVGQDGTLFLQSREPARLYVVSPAGDGATDTLVSTVVLSQVSREDTGHTIFHTNSGGSVACASCHWEGGDDAQTWNFGGVKPRRTPSLLGTVKGTAPYHWDADFADLQALAHEVYTRRMSGRLLAADQVSALQNWIERLPAPKRPAVDKAAQARGQVLFEGKAACGSCHSGPSFTNNQTMDVGTGMPLQVPPLVGVGSHPPFLHDGCAKTLADRFAQCATGAHGQTANLTPSEVSDLVTFMQAL